VWQYAPRSAGDALNVDPGAVLSGRRAVAPGPSAAFSRTPAHFGPCDLSCGCTGSMPLWAFCRVSSRRPPFAGDSTPDQPISCKPGFAAASGCYEKCGSALSILASSTWRLASLHAEIPAPRRVRWSGARSCSRPLRSSAGAWRTSGAGAPEPCERSRPGKS
jgi:hypothetical protein